MTSKRWKTPTLLLLGAWLAAACASAPAAPASLAIRDTGKAFCWEVKDRDGRGTAYVVGSVHLGKEGTLTPPASMDAAFTRSDTLVVEVDPAKTEPAVMQKLVLELARMPQGQTLSNRLGPGNAPLLRSAADRAGLPMLVVDALRPWMASMVLSVTELQRAGYKPELGVDRTFLDRAKKDGKVVVELETSEGQLRMLAEMPDPLQDLMLNDQLHRSRPAEEALKDILAAWTAGDAASMSSLVLEGANDATYRPVYERIFFERNVKMAEGVAALLAQPRTTFVVVGAGHVVGPDGIVALLQKQGHSVRQLDRDAP